MPVGTEMLPLIVGQTALTNDKTAISTAVGGDETVDATVIDGETADDRRTGAT